MKLEDVNVVGKDLDTVMQHVFACHDEIKKLRKKIDNLEGISL